MKIQFEYSNNDNDNGADNNSNNNKNKSKNDNNNPRSFEISGCHSAEFSHFSQAGEASFWPWFSVT